MTQDTMKALPGLAKALKDLDTALRGQMATVERVDGHMVTVTTPGRPGVTGPYPASVTDLSAGDVGVLLPLRGTNALFIPVGWEGETPTGPTGDHIDLVIPGFTASLPANATNWLMTSSHDLNQPFPVPGRVIGLVVKAAAAITAGTATFGVSPDLAHQGFAGGAVQLNTTKTREASGFALDGPVVQAGQRLWLNVTTANLAPVNTPVTAYAIVRLAIGE